jgi:hypothetical protein
MENKNFINTDNGKEMDAKEFTSFVLDFFGCKKTKYKQQKEKARQLAIDWQIEFSENDHYMSEYAYWGEKFEKLGKRYGLLKEFRENGII